MARALLGDPDEIEQQTWLQALEHGGGEVERPRPWLGRIARNVAKDLHRGEQRRARHEPSVAREAQTPSAAELIEREEARRTLVDAVDQLPEGSRTAIWLRYFEGHPPRDIAARLDIPVTTVWTQLRRGLAMLRERLGDEPDRRALLLPLLVSVAPPTGKAATAGVLSWMGLLWMTVKTKWIGGTAVALVLFAAAIGWWWPGADGDVSPPDPGAAPGVMRAAADPAAPPSVAKEAGARTPADEVDPGSVSASRSTDKAIVRGRCVDPSGVPLAGVVAELHGWNTGQHRMDWYLQNDGGPIRWTDPDPVTTGPDGRFAFSFDPPPPYQFALDLDLRGRLPMRGRWSEIGPGEVIELGEVRLDPGPRVHGVIVDRNGDRVRPSRRCGLSLSRRPTGPGEARPFRVGTYVNGDISDEGEIEFPCAIPSGEWDISTSPWIPVVGKPTVKVTGKSVELRVVVEVVDQPANGTSHNGTSTDGGQPAGLVMAGTVLDENGDPVAGALVATRDASVTRGRTDRYGHFVLRASRGVRRGDKVQLSVKASGYVDHAPEAEFAWGADDLKLVIKIGSALTVRVVRAGSNEPVERFGVRLEALWRTRFWDKRRVHGGWHHPGGTLKIPGLGPGDYRIWVQPVRSSGLVEARRAVRITAGAPPCVQFELPTPVRQPVVVRSRRGAPVVGSTVQLIDAMGKEVTISSAARRHDVHRFPNRGTLLDEAVTDEEGRVVLAGPPHKTLVLRVRGEHPTLVCPTAPLSTRPIELTTSIGATLRVRADPVRVLADWKRVRVVWPKGVPIAPGNAPPVGVRLARSGNRRVKHPAFFTPPVRFDSDGIATIRHVPAGRWDVEITYPAVFRRGSMLTPLRGVELGEGQDRLVVADLSSFRTGRLEAKLSTTGRLGPSAIYLSRTLPFSRKDGKPQKENLAFGANDDGWVIRELSAGTWSVSFDGSIDGRYQRVGLPPITIVAGAVLRTTLAVDAASAKLRLLDPSGQPAAGATLVARSADHPEVEVVAVADQAGQVELRGAPGSYRVRARIRSLSQADRWADHVGELYERHAADAAGLRAAMDQATVELGTVTLPAPSGETLTLRLPKGWDR